MCDIGMKEAIEKLAKAIEIASAEILKPKIEATNLWPNTGGILKIKDVPMEEELKNAAKLALKDREGIQTISFYDVPKVDVSSDGIKVKHEHGSITFNNEGLSFDFGVALENIKKGLKVCRKGWNGKGMFIQCQVPDEFSKMTQAYAYITAGKKVVPWTPSQEDIFAADWMIYIGE